MYIYISNHPSIYKYMHSFIYPSILHPFIYMHHLQYVCRLSEKSKVSWQAIMQLHASSSPLSLIDIHLHTIIPRYSLFLLRFGNGASVANFDIWSWTSSWTSSSSSSSLSSTSSTENDDWNSDDSWMDESFHYDVHQSTS